MMNNVERCNCKETVKPGNFTMFIHEEETEILILATVPGVDKDRIELSVLDDVLIFKINPAAEITGEFFNRFEKLHVEEEIELPAEVDAAKAETKLENGCLCIKLPKAKSAMPKRIKIS